jgi:secretion/DNA translocation related CpaE-like protein
MNLARPLLISDSTDLIDECARLAAASGAELHVISHAAADRSRWSHAPLVLVDMAGAAAVEKFPRRGGVIVVTFGASDAVDPDAWRIAVSIGAEHVVCLPDASDWLAEQLSARVDEPAHDGRLVAFLSASGGAGASTLAAACAVRASAHGETSLLIDGDRLGGGIDLVIGGEDAAGIRWPELVDTRGRLATSAFRQALPLMSGISVLSWDREGSPEASADSWNAVLDAGMRGFDLTVVDLPRNPGGDSVSIVSRANSVVLVVSARVRGTIAAARLLEEIAPLATDIRIVVRERPGGVRPEAVAQILGVPLHGTIPLGSSFTDDGQLPKLPDALLEACVMQGAGRRSTHAA